MIPAHSAEHEAIRKYAVQTIGWVTALTLVGTFIGLELRRRGKSEEKRGHIWTPTTDDHTTKN